MKKNAFETSISASVYKGGYSGIHFAGWVTSGIVFLIKPIQLGNS